MEGALSQDSVKALRGFEGAGFLGVSGLGL